MQATSLRARLAVRQVTGARGSGAGARRGHLRSAGQRLRARTPRTRGSCVGRRSENARVGVTRTRAGVRVTRKQLRAAIIDARTREQLARLRGEHWFTRIEGHARGVQSRAVQLQNRRATSND